MPALSTPGRYGAVAQLFHWLTFVLVVAAYLTSPGGSEQRVYSAAVDVSRQLHETLGMTVFAVVLLRIVWRAIDRVPETPPAEPWLQRLASLMHVVLYTLLLAIPLTAVTGAWLEGHPVTLLGLEPIGPLLPRFHEIGQGVATLHTLLGNAILWAAALHAAAALFHHYWLRDRVLVSMLPGRMPAPPTGKSATRTAIIAISRPD